MTITEARKALSGPLKFGDPAQMAAHEFLVAVEQCADVLEKCSHGGSAVCLECDGEGVCPHCERECEECDGTGFDGDCECVEGIPDDVKLASIGVTDERKKAKEETEQCAANLN